MQYHHPTESLSHAPDAVPEDAGVWKSGLRAVSCDDGRWFGLDPTNDIAAADKHIRIAVGRDARDCPMNRGIYYGAAAQEILRPYGFSFFDLAESSPKAGKTKDACCKAVLALLKNEELLDKMRKNKALPMKELELASGVARKILDRHRRYIIAAAEILSGEYPVLAEYLGYIRKALKT